jgi:hypothetical protein
MNMNLWIVLSADVGTNKFVLANFAAIPTGNWFTNMYIRLTTLNFKSPINK